MASVPIQKKTLKQNLLYVIMKRTLRERKTPKLSEYDSKRYKSPAFFLMYIFWQIAESWHAW